DPVERLAVFGRRSRKCATCRARRGVCKQMARLEVAPVIRNPVHNLVRVTAELFVIHPWRPVIRRESSDPVRVAYFSSLKLAWRFSIGSYLRSSIRSGCFLGFLVVTYM